jgi:RNA polymerase sigma factor (sigma-70 family)
MSLTPGNLDGGRALVRQCLDGDTSALVKLREEHNSTLTNILLARGASVDEAKELLADLWGDCVPTSDDRTTLLEKFSGKCLLQAWLVTVATRRWIDLKRKQTRRGETSQPQDPEIHSQILERLPAVDDLAMEDALVALLRESLLTAFADCPAADMLMLRLLYVHGITQRELMRMWNWSESKVSRKLSKSMELIQQKTLEHLKQKDPWLHLTWQDFIDLCQTQRVGFL